MTDHRTGTREEWLAARPSCSTRRRSTPAAETHSPSSAGAPWVTIDKAYTFETRGHRTLGIFPGRSQLLMYHFMFGPE